MLSCCGNFPAEGRKPFAHGISVMEIQVLQPSLTSCLQPFSHQGDGECALLFLSFATS